MTNVACFHGQHFSCSEGITTCPAFLYSYSLFQMAMCIPLIYISNRHELVQTYLRENVQQMTRVIFCKLLYGGFILSESESV